MIITGLRTAACFHPHLMALGLASVLEQEMGRDVSWYWRTFNEISFPDVDSESAGEAVRQCALHWSQAEWVNTVDSSGRSVFSPWRKTANEDTWRRSRRQLISRVDTDLERRFIAALGSHLGHNHWDKTPANRGGNIIDQRIRPLSTTIAGFTPGQIAREITGQTVTHQGFTATDMGWNGMAINAEPADTVRSWLAYIGISVFPLYVDAAAAIRTSGYFQHDHMLYAALPLFDKPVSVRAYRNLIATHAAERYAHAAMLQGITVDGDPASNRLDEYAHFSMDGWPDLADTGAIGIVFGRNPYDPDSKAGKNWLESGRLVPVPEREPESPWAPRTGALDPNEPRGLKYLRETRGLTVRALADRVGVGVGAGRISQWEAWGSNTDSSRDPRAMSLDTAHHMAEALNMTVDEFWEALGQPVPQTPIVIEPDPIAPVSELETTGEDEEPRPLKQVAAFSPKSRRAKRGVVRSEGGLPDQRFPSLSAAVTWLQTEDGKPKAQSGAIGTAANTPGRTAYGYVWRYDN